MKKIKNSSLSLLILILLSTLGCGEKNKSQTFYAMGGIPVHITATGVSETWLKEAAENARIAVESWEQELSLYRPDSTVNRLASSKGDPVEFSKRGFAALQYASQIEIMTSGAFDISVGPIIKTWKNAEKNNRLPTESELQSALAYTGFDHLIMDNETQTLRIKQATSNPDSPTTTISPSGTIWLDVGGFAKGLFAEWISEEILLTARESGITPNKLLVDLGGDMFVNCLNSEAHCRVGIRDPFSPARDALWGILSIDHGAVVTSGTYERHFMIEGKRYCHIVDPRTAMPVENNIVSVTVVNKSGAFADALATSVFVLGETDGRDLIENIAFAEMVLIRNDGSYYVTDSLKDKLTKL